MVLLADADSLSSSSGDDARTRADLLGHSCDVIFIAPAPSRPPWRLTTARDDDDEDEDDEDARPRAPASIGRLVHAVADIGIVVIAVSFAALRASLEVMTSRRSAPLFFLFFEPRVIR
jgi:hypothetical protein